MRKGYTPALHHHRLIDDITPSMRWDGESDLGEWQEQAKEKLYDLLGIAEIEPYRTAPEIDIEYDVIAEDLGCREIRFRFKSEKNVTTPCHMIIPNGADKPLPVMITLQGHGSGMHLSLGRAKFPKDGGDEYCRDSVSAFAKRAVEEGVVAVALEQRGLGENGGNTENGATQCWEPAMRAMLLGRTLIGERVWDVMRLIDTLEAFFTDIVDTSKIMCLGNSGGGTTTIYASVLEDRIKIGIPSCAVCEFADSIGFMYHCNCNYIPGIAKYFDMGDLCAMAAPKDLIVVNGRQDNIFLVVGAINCVDVARLAYQEIGADEKLVHIIGPLGHQFFPDTAWPYIHKALNEL